MARPGRRQSRNAAMSKKDRDAIAMERFAARKARECVCGLGSCQWCGVRPDDYDERDAPARTKQKQYEGPEDPDITF